MKFGHWLFLLSELALVLGIVGWIDVTAGGIAATSITLIQRHWHKREDVVRSSSRTIARWLLISGLLDMLLISAALLVGFHVASPGFVRTLENHMGLAHAALNVSLGLFGVRVSIVIFLRLSEWAYPLH